MDKFCVLLEKILKARENGEQISDDEDETTSRRKDAEKHLECVTTGIEKKKSVEMLSEKQRIKRGKVSQRLGIHLYCRTTFKNKIMMRKLQLNHCSLVDDSFRLLNFHGALPL